MKSRKYVDAFAAFDNEEKRRCKVGITCINKKKK